MKNDEEMYQSLLMRFQAYQAKKRQRRRTLRRTVPVLAGFGCAAVSGFVWRTHFTELPEIPVQQIPEEPPVTTVSAAGTEAVSRQTARLQSSLTAPAVPEESAQQTEPTEPQGTQAVSEDVPASGTEAAPLRQTEPPVTAALPPQTTASLLPPATTAAAAETAKPPAPQTTKAQTDPGSPGTPGAVFTSMTVSYEEAKELFGHPIRPCSSADFLRYKAGIVSRNGNVHADGAFCLSVTYEFSGGQITLTDRDRMRGSDGDPLAEQIDYCGRTFYVLWPDAYDDSLRITYYAAGFDPFELSGMEYQAVFGKDADIDRIMDLLIALEM
ncbi:MAG: hypothetical protein J5753_07750 [Oscillospiraceae bacterium]|nr:hypothetical protein [Oscillospiraceae bacterium]